MSYERIAGRHGYGYVPLFPEPGRETFSVGIFEWLPNADGKSVKVGPYKVRVVGRGLSSGTSRGPVASVCDMIVEQLDAGTYSGPRRVNSWELS